VCTAIRDTRVYGLNDAARQFYDSVVEELKELDCKQSSLDPSLFYKTSSDGKLLGVIVGHMDDFLHAGDAEFDDSVINYPRRRFIAGGLEERCFSCVGFQIKPNDTGILVDLSNYAESIVNVKLCPEGTSWGSDELSNEEYTGLRSLAGCISRLMKGCGPDLAFEVIETSTRFGAGTVSDLTRVVVVRSTLAAKAFGLQKGMFSPKEQPLENNYFQFFRGVKL
jgi:hypothetical protein